MVQKKWYLDVKRTPCAREALMHGIVGGMGLGMLYFLKSSESIRFKWNFDTSIFLTVIF